MPRGSPFTKLCQQAAKITNPPRADLHIHTTASDGDFTPSQIVMQARAAKLTAIAITDHDTTWGFEEALTTADSLTRHAVNIITGVEISTVFGNQSYHMLGYGFDIANIQLQTALQAIRDRRRLRFEAYLQAFEHFHATVPLHLLTGLDHPQQSVGRRNLAKLLVAAGFANNHQIAFLKYIHPSSIPASHSVPMEEAIQWVHDAGGVTSLAHPPSTMTLETLKSMRLIGLDAVEANCPSVGWQFGQTLKEWACSLGMSTTAGSDYHGDGHTLGSRTIDSDGCAKLLAMRRSHGF